MSEVREYLRPNSKRLVMSAAVVKGNFILASGVAANEKFDIDRITDGSEELQLCVNGLVNCIESNFKAPVFNKGNRYAFSAIGSIANGATRLGERVSREVGIRHIKSRKDENGDFYIDDVFHDDEDLLILDDVYTAGTNMNKYQRALPSGMNVIGGLVLLNRSPIANVPLLANGTPVYSVLREVF